MFQMIFDHRNFEGSLLFKMLKYFKVMLNIFEFSHVKEIAEN